MLKTILNYEGSPWKTGGFPVMPSTFEGMSGDPLLDFTRHADKGLEVIESELGPLHQIAD